MSNLVLVCRLVLWYSLVFVVVFCVGAMVDALVVVCLSDFFVGFIAGVGSLVDPFVLNNLFHYCCCFVW